MSSKFRRIAARGITPEYRGAQIGEAGFIYGTIGYFEHFGHMTVVGVWDVDGILHEHDFAHLQEVDVYA